MRCDKCRFRGLDSTDNRSYTNGCDYMSMTGNSRLKGVYQMLGVKRLTKEAQELLRPENCPFFEKGKRGQVRALDMLSRRRLEEGQAPAPAAKGAGNAKRKKRRRKIDTDFAMRLYRSGMLDREIAAQIGVSANAVNSWRKGEGLPSNAPPRRSPDGEAIRALHAQGLNDREIGRKLGMRPVAVCKWRHKHGLPSNFDPHKQRKEASPCS